LLYNNKSNNGIPHNPSTVVTRSLTEVQVDTLRKKYKKRYGHMYILDLKYKATELLLGVTDKGNECTILKCIKTLLNLFPEDAGPENRIVYHYSYYSY
jgi:hypothetical protein